MSETTVDSIAVGWVLLPVLLGLLFYCAIVLCTWPYARPIVPIWLLFFAILIPPFFPFLLFYLLWFTLLFPVVVEPPPPRGRQVVLVIEPSGRGRVVARTSTAGQPPARAISRPQGNRV